MNGAIRNVKNYCCNIYKIFSPFLPCPALVQCAWDPLSSSQTLRIVSLMKGLMQDFPTVSTEHKNTQALLKAAVVKLRQAMDNDIFIPLIATK